MSTPLDRFRLLIQLENVKMPWLEAQTGIDRKRWANLKHEKAEIRAIEFQALSLVWPEYTIWLTNGSEIPEAGQISPLTKQIHKNYKTAD